ncbi:MAG: NADP-dependent isocitrate dehydrogenase [Bacillota bacterium]
MAYKRQGDAPNQLVVPYIDGDGVGPEIWAACSQVLKAAVERAYGGRRSMEFCQVFAGKKALAAFGELLPAQTLQAFREHGIGIKGPLETPVGSGYRSLNVAIRLALDLFACIRPVRYFIGVPCRLLQLQNIDLVIFRENTEDLYMGLEFPSGSSHVGELRKLANAIPHDSAVALKVVSESRSKRLVRAAIHYALRTGRQRVTVVHKGNIMKFTEGSFRDWAFEVARNEFGDRVILEPCPEVPSGKVVLDDCLADNMMQQLVLRPENYQVIVTTNLNGDYLSELAAALVGGVGIAPGANVGASCAVFEATHGTAPDIAGKGRANPSSLILSGAMMLEYVGWSEAARSIWQAVAATFAAGFLTDDLASGHGLSTEEFANKVVEALPS